MKKSSYFVAVLMIAILIVIFGALFLIGDYRKKNPEEYDQVTQRVVDYGVTVNEDSASHQGTPDLQQEQVTQVTASGEMYYLILKENKVSIYRADGEIFYDFADVRLETMPVEIQEQLKLGLYIRGEDELYDFLQTYSS